MKITVWKINGQWRWHMVNVGRITAQNESHPTKSNAVRAAKSVVNAVLKQVGYAASNVTWTEKRITTTGYDEEYVLKFK
jgi:histone H3/H4